MISTDFTGPSMISTDFTGPSMISTDFTGPSMISTDSTGPSMISTDSTGPNGSTGTKPIDLTIGTIVTPGIKPGTVTATTITPGEKGSPPTRSEITGTIPSKPLNVNATSGDDSQSTITFDPPENKDSSYIDYYIVYSSDNRKVKEKNSPITFTGLSNDKNYNFYVVAYSKLGESPRSDTSEFITPKLSFYKTKLFIITMFILVFIIISSIGYYMYKKNKNMSSNISPNMKRNIAPKMTRNISPKMTRNISPKMTRNIQPKMPPNIQPKMTRNIQPNIQPKMPSYMKNNITSNFKRV
jgi:hypothetical protein